MEAELGHFDKTGTVSRPLTARDVESLLAPQAKSAATSGSVVLSEVLRVLRFIVASSHAFQVEVSDEAITQLDALCRAALKFLAPPKDARTWKRTNVNAALVVTLLVDLRQRRSHSAMAYFSPLELKAAHFASDPRADHRALCERCHAALAGAVPTDPSSRRACALTAPSAAEAAVLMELLNADTRGPKPRVVGSAPTAVMLAGGTAPNYTVLDRISAYVDDQLNHATIADIALNTGRSRRGNSETAGDVAATAAEYVSRLELRLMNVFQNIDVPIALVSSTSMIGYDLLAALAVAVSFTHPDTRTGVELLACRRSLDTLQALYTASPEFHSFETPFKRLATDGAAPDLLQLSPGSRTHATVSNSFLLGTSQHLLPPLTALHVASAGSDTDAVEDTLLDLLEGGFGRAPCPGAPAHIALVLSKMGAVALTQAGSKMTSQLLLLASQQPHAGIPLVKTALAASAAHGGDWVADSLLRLAFFPLMTFAASCEIDMPHDVDAQEDPAYTLVVRFINELGAPTGVHVLPSLAAALSNAPHREAAEAWASFAHDACTPMSVRMSAAARIVPEMLCELGRAMAECTSLPPSLMQTVLFALRFMVFPAALQPVAADVLQRVAKRLLLDAPPAIAECSVDPVMEHLSADLTVLSAPEGAVECTAWAISTMGLLLVTRRSALSVSASFFERLHELTWAAIADLTHKQSSRTASCSWDLSRPISESAPLQLSGTVNTKPTGVATQQILASTVATMATLTALDAALVERALVCIGAVWRATQEAAPAIAQICVTCLAACTQVGNSTPSLQQTLAPAQGG